MTRLRLCHGIRFHLARAGANGALSKTTPLTLVKPRASSQNAAYKLSGPNVSELFVARVVVIAQPLMIQPE